MYQYIVIANLFVGHESLLLEQGGNRAVIGFY